MSAAWFCPSCQRYHAPHCDTCPKPADAIGTTPIPAVRPISPQPYRPDPNSPPWMPYYVGDQLPWSIGEGQTIAIFAGGNLLTYGWAN